MGNVSRIGAVIYPLIFGVALTGCGSLGSGPNTISRVRLVNALIGSPNGGVNFVQRGLAVNLNSAVLYGQVQPSGVPFVNYYTVVSGGNSITGGGVNTDLYPAPATSGAVLAPEQSFLLSPHTSGQSDGTYTIIAAGIVGQNGGNAPALLRAIDNVPAIPSGTSNTYLRVINLAPDTVGTAGLNMNSNGQPIQGLVNIAYGTPNSSSNYIAIPTTGNTLFNLSVTYAVSNASIPTQHSLNGMSLLAGHAYSIFLIGEVNPTSGAPAFDYILAEDS